MDLVSSFAGGAGLDFTALGLSLTTLLVVLIGHIRQRRQRIDHISPSSPGPFTSEMTIQMLAQQYAQSLDKILQAVDDEKRMLSSLTAPVPAGAGSIPESPRSTRSDAEGAPLATRRMWIVGRMADAFAEAEELIEGGLSPAEVFNKRPVSKEGIDLIAKVKAARVGANPAGRGVE